MTQARQGRLSWIIAIAAAMATMSSSRAADLPDVTLCGIASGAALQFGFTGNGKRVLPETVYLHGDHTRLEFQTADGLGYVLRAGNGVWLVSEKAGLARPVPSTPTARQYVFDTTEPCKNMGVSCEREGAQNIAGHEAHGWRFRHAGTRGPDGSDSGILWIDTQYGLLLAYHAQDLQGHSLDWTVTAVSFAPLPAGLFELPQNGPPGKQ